LHEIDRTEDAIAAFNAGLEDTPEAIDLIEELALTLPEDRKQEFVAAFKALPDPMEHFEYLADSFENYEDSEALETLIEVASTLSSELPHINYYKILPLIFNEDYDVAFAKLAQAIKDPKTDQDYLTFYESWLCNVAVHLGREIEAYETCTDKGEALNTLVYRLQYFNDDDAEMNESEAQASDTKRKELIDSLYERHLSAVPDDPNAWFMIADREMEAEDYQAALTHYTKALELTDDPDGRYALVESCVDCYVELDQAVHGYQSLKDKKTAFQCFSYVLESDSDAFKAIQQQYREQFPNDLEVRLPEIESLYETEKFAEVLELADAVIAEADPDDVNEWKLSRVRFYRILALAHLKRTDQALIESRNEDDHIRDQLRTLIYAIKGQRQRFTEAYKRCVEVSDYFDADQVLDYVKVPRDWIPEMTATEDTEFYRYFEPRRIVFLLPDPIQISAFQVSQATEAVGLRLSEIRKSEISTHSEDFYCALNDRAVLVATDQCKYFLSVGNEPYATDSFANLDTLSVEWDVELNDEDLVAGYEALLKADERAMAGAGKDSSDDGGNPETDSGGAETENTEGIDTEAKLKEDEEAQKALREAVDAHRGWFAIDIYTWPQDVHKETAVTIPAAARHRLAELAKQIVGQRSTVAVHPDSGHAVACSKEFFEALLGDEPMSAFGLDEE
ncbi:MAG: hypothetical protein KDB00_30210, partial [Planctomycetales bacterium]|nr:hypothetical protein [Planctomycetales bacterium]